MRRVLLVPLLVLACLLGRPAPAAADATAFWGFSTTPSTRSARGFGVGVSLLVVGFEFEYSSTTQDLSNASPSLKTFMFNASAQTPTRMQLYATVGGGLYSEGLSGSTHRSFGTNVGGGAKIPLAGPFRLRLDFRVFNLHGDAIYKNPKRFYAGLNLAF